MSLLSSERMSKTQSNMEISERKLNASKAGIESQKTGKPSKSWFSRERWDNMSKSEQQSQVIKANKAAHAKISAMTSTEKTLHYRKVMKGCMGFISKGQQDLFDSIKHLGFIDNEQIDNMSVDSCHKDYKIIVEYNGDAYHCNPKVWTPETYSTLIKMYAKDKWAMDRRRFYKLKRMGYYVYIVWESDWKADKQNIINKIEKIYETRKQNFNQSHEKL